MSRASKITFALSCVFTVTTVVGVHIVQGMERDTLHQGPIKDAQRIAARKQLQEQELLDRGSNSNLDPEKERTRLINKSEHELQQKLREKYEAIQPLSGEVVTKDGEVIKGNGK